jgi:hypothetical protein
LANVAWKKLRLFAPGAFEEERDRLLPRLKPWTGEQFDGGQTPSNAAICDAHAIFSPGRGRSSNLGCFGWLEDRRE